MSAPGQLPLLATATVELDEPGVGFVDTTGLGAGYCWLNGFLLGRYWSIGPTRTLHAPRGLWRPGTNRLTVLELECGDPMIALAAQPHL